MECVEEEFVLRSAAVRRRLGDADLSSTERSIIGVISVGGMLDLEGCSFRL